MEPKFQSSFIPKGPLATTGTATKTSRQSERSLLGTLAVFVFVIAILASGGVFGFQFYIKSNIGKMVQDLSAARTLLKPEIIEKISALDSRIVSTQTLLDSHTVISPLFFYLQESTVRAVRFSSFKYSTGDDGPSLSMKGQARGYTALALQSQIFNSSQYMKNVKFGDLVLDDEGNVSFSLEADLDRSIVSFKAGEDENKDEGEVEPVINTSEVVPTSEQL